MWISRASNELREDLSVMMIGGGQLKRKLMILNFFPSSSIQSNNLHFLVQDLSLAPPYFKQQVDGSPDIVPGYIMHVVRKRDSLTDILACFVTLMNPYPTDHAVSVFDHVCNDICANLDFFGNEEYKYGRTHCCTIGAISEILPYLHHLHRININIFRRAAGERGQCYKVPEKAKAKL